MLEVKPDVFGGLVDLVDESVNKVLRLEKADSPTTVLVTMASHLALARVLEETLLKTLRECPSNAAATEIEALSAELAAAVSKKRGLR